MEQKEEEHRRQTERSTNATTKSDSLHLTDQLHRTVARFATRRQNEHRNCTEKGDRTDTLSTSVQQIHQAQQLLAISATITSTVTATATDTTAAIVCSEPESHR